MDAADWIVIERLQQGIPLCPRPFAAMAEDLGMSEHDFLRRIRALMADGSVRRLGPRVRHHQAGILGNIMVAWQVPDDRVDEVGATLAASPSVTHCYERPPFEGFPYNVYSMVHAADLPAAESIVRELSDLCGVREYQMLRTVRELKKSTPVYRHPEGDHAN
jgi:DNA-binding Lrp family transcriptional regulator